MAAEDFVLSHIDKFNSHDAEGWANNYADDAVLYDPQYPEPKRGRDAVKKDIQDFFSAFPDMQFRVVGVTGSGEHCAVQGVGAGTHNGPMEGPQGTIEATGKAVEIPFASFLRLNQAGKIAEERRYYDLAGMMGQLGLM
jgi:steroid delta-isomerase-like uncharacterized protein